MTNENIKNLWKFQQLVKSDNTFKTAEEQLKTLRHSIEDAVYSEKDAEELTPEEYQKYQEIEQLLYKVQDFVQEQERKVDWRKGEIGYELEKALRSEE